MCAACQDHNKKHPDDPYLCIREGDNVTCQECRLKKQGGCTGGGRCPKFQRKYAKAYERAWKYTFQEHGKAHTDPRKWPSFPRAAARRLRITHLVDTRIRTRAEERDLADDEAIAREEAGLVSEALDSDSDAESDRPSDGDSGIEIQEGRRQDNQQEQARDQESDVRAQNAAALPVSESESNDAQPVNSDDDSLERVRADMLAMNHRLRQTLATLMESEQVLSDRVVRLHARR
ncbi:unnamed protein product [Jaminaea pallidilutea]